MGEVISDVFWLWLKTSFSRSLRPPTPCETWLIFPDGDTKAIQRVSTFVGVRRTRSIYIHSSFGGYNSIAPTGVRQVLAKIPVTVGYGNLVHETMSGSEHDCIHVGTHVLSQFKLTLHDAAGVELDLQGTSWSCTLVFQK